MKTAPPMNTFDFFKYLTSDSLYLCSPLKHKDIFYIFKNLQSIFVWSQTAKGILVF